MNGLEISSNKVEQNTKIFIGALLLIILLQNGFLNNIPIILIIVPLIFYSKRYKYQIGKIEKLILWYAIYLFLITIIKIKDNYNISYTINMFIQYVIIYWGIKLGIQKIDINKVLIFIRNLGIILSVLCIPEALTGKHFLAEILGKNIIQVSNIRVVSVFNHPIVAGVFLLTSFIILIMYPLKKRIEQTIGCAILLLAIILTQSRSVWVATIFVFMVYMLKFGVRKINKNYLLYIILFIALIIGIGAILGYNVVSEIWSYIYRRWQGTLEAGEGQIVRIEIMIKSYEFWKDNISSFFFGNGKNFGLKFINENPIVKFGGVFVWKAAIDNQYLTLIHETGIIGLGLILYAIVITIKRLFYAKKDNIMQISACLCILGNCICIFFFEGFSYPMLVLLYILLIIISDNSEKINNSVIKNRLQG